MLKIVGIIFLSIVCSVYLETMTKSANNFGPYNLKFDDYGDCKGPKAKNLTIMKTSLDTQRLISFVNINFINDTKIDEVKVQVHNMKNNKKHFLWHYKLTEPCKHFAIAAIIKEQLNAINCLTRKGNYSFQLNFGDLVQLFFGKAFFYGTYIYKADVASKKGNIGCFRSTLTFKKKTLV